MNSGSNSRIRNTGAKGVSDRGAGDRRHPADPVTLIAAEPNFVEVDDLRGAERLLGSLLIDAGRLTPKDVERIIAEQERSGKRFGEAARTLGLIKGEELDEALARQFDAPLLPQKRERPISSRVVAAYKPMGRVGEAMRALREQLMQRWFDGSRTQSALLMAGVDRSEGRSFITANLAVAFAQLGARTLLIDADLRNPVQHTLFKLKNRRGLTHILSGRSNQSEIVQLPFLPALAILPSGPLPPNPQELLARAPLAGLIADVTGRFDVVLIDSSASSSSADVQAIARRIGGTCLIARRNRTSLERLADFDNSLQHAGSKVVGVVFNDY